MKIDKFVRDDYCILALKGEFDTFYVPSLQDEVQSLLDAERPLTAAPAGAKARLLAPPPYRAGSSAPSSSAKQQRGPR